MTRPATGAGWAGRRVLVAGAGVSGAAVVDALLPLGAELTVTDRAGSPGLSALAAPGVRAAADLAEPPAGTALVVTSPGWRPDHPLLAAAAADGVEVVGEPELAWRLRPPGAAPWLALTGTNGKTTTVRMLESVLRAAGRRAVAAGNVGLPLVTAVLDPEPYDVLAVELSSFQLYWSSTIRPYAAAVLNVAPDHLDWHGSLAAYTAAKARLLAPGTRAVLNADDPAVRGLRPDAVRFTLGPPAEGELGVEAGRLVDRAYGTGVLADVGDVRPAGPHNVANALAAAALALAYGVGAEAVRPGLREFVPDPHRNAPAGVVDGVTYVDDSKATNPHAAAASLAGYDRVVWVAGGLLKGADVDDLVAAHAGRLAGAVLLGRDRAVIRDALARHAPEIPVAEVAATDDGVMTEVVRLARALARPGDTVLLAPAAASMDLFTDYRARGDAFAGAVAALAGEPG